MTCKCKYLSWRDGHAFEGCIFKHHSYPLNFAVTVLYMRTTITGTGGAKKPRPDDQLVDEVIQQQQQQVQSGDPSEGHSANPVVEGA